MCRRPEFLDDGLCPTCRKPTGTAVITIGSRNVTVSLQCDECRERDSAAAEAKRQEAHRQAQVQQRQQLIRSLFEQSNMSPRYMAATFDSWDNAKNPQNRPAYESVREYAAAWPQNKGQGLIITGPTGTGKTHLAASLATYLMAEKSSVVIFQAVTDLFMALRATYRKDREDGPDESQIFRTIQDADLLILDDLGAEKWSQWAEERLYMAIDYRYRHIKPTVITTNLTMKELEEAIGTRAMDRLAESCKVVRLTGTSVRREKQPEAHKSKQMKEGSADGKAFEHRRNSDIPAGNLPNLRSGM